MRDDGVWPPGLKAKKKKKSLFQLLDAFGAILDSECANHLFTSSRCALPLSPTRSLSTPTLQEGKNTWGAAEVRQPCFFCRLSFKAGKSMTLLERGGEYNPTASYFHAPLPSCTVGSPPLELRRLDAPFCLPAKGPSSGLPEPHIPSVNSARSKKSEQGSWLAVFASARKVKQKRSR